jgi:succinoglycan biosynthesis protein ExoA
MFRMVGGSELRRNFDTAEQSASTALVSIVIPCRNEFRFISACLTSVLENGYPLEYLEVLVLDGMSDDGTRDLLLKYPSRYRFIRIVDNVQKVTPYALNIENREAKGEVLMRIDAHTIYERGYIARCVEVLLKFGADDVSATLRIVPQDDTFVGRSIIKALTHKFGVGDLRYRFARPEEPEPVDTVAFFCVKRELFQRIGLFNEKLARIQDMEFKRRLARSGCKILLVPGTFSDYQARSDLGSFWRRNWSDGVWTVLAFAHSELMPVRRRHLAPAAFVAVLVTALIVH